MFIESDDSCLHMYEHFAWRFSQNGENETENLCRFLERENACVYKIEFWLFIYKLIMCMAKIICKRQCPLYRSKECQENFEGFEKCIYAIIFFCLRNLAAVVHCSMMWLMYMSLLYCYNNLLTILYFIFICLFGTLSVKLSSNNKFEYFDLWYHYPGYNRQWFSSCSILHVSEGEKTELFERMWGINLVLPQFLTMIHLER